MEKPEKISRTIKKKETKQNVLAAKKTRRKASPRKARSNKKTATSRITGKEKTRKESNVKREDRVAPARSTSRTNASREDKRNNVAKEERASQAKTSSADQTIIDKVRIHQSVAILVDGNNIEMSIHSMLNKKKAMINFDTLVPKLLKERGLNRLIYFREGKSISSKLAERLHNLYYGTVVPCHKSADIPLTIAATQIAEKVDTIIILSGDADYVELVKHLTSRGVRVEIAAVEQTTASILRDAVDHFFPITREDCFVLG